MRTAICSFITVWISLGLALAPIPSVAAPPDGDGAQPQGGAPDPDAAVLSEAKGLFDAGVARYTAADYKAAVDLWLEAYTMLPPTYANRLIKAELIYNVARAEQKSFEIDRDVRHLRQSREILQGYLREVDELYPVDQVELERERVQARINELSRQITEFEAEQRRRDAELAERMRPNFDEQADARDKTRNQVMIGAGAGFTALGGVGVGLLVSGVIMARNADATVETLPLESDITSREQAINRGRSANAMLITGAVAGVVLLAVGVPLLGVGLASENERKQRRADAGLDDRARLDHIGPTVLPGGAGLSLTGRF